MNKTAKNAAIYFVGTVVMGVIGLVNTMLLTRALTEQAYVMYGFLHNFATTSVMFLCFGFDTSYARFYYKHDQTQKRFLWRVFLIPCCLFLLFAIAVVEPHQRLLHQVFGAELPIYAVFLLVAYLLFSLVHRFTQLTARMEERAINYVASNFIGRFGFVILIFVVFLLSREKVNFDWVLLSSLMGAVLATLLNLWIFFQLKKDTNEDGTKISNREMIAYGFPHMLNNVLFSAIPLIEKIVIRNVVGEKIGLSLLGIYTAASVFQTVVSMVTLTVNNIWNPLVFKHCENEKVFKPILHNFGLATSVITVVGFSLCLLLRRWLVLILDRLYYDAYIIAPTICFCACYGILTTIYGSGINIAKKTIHHVIEPVFQLILTVGLCYWLLPLLGLKGIGIALLFSMMISRTCKIIVGLHLYDTGVSEHKMWILMGVCTAVAFASLFFTSFLADAVMFVALIAAMLLILNKDLLMVIQTAKTLMIPSKKSEKN